jgi:hypothetical protein
MTCISATSLDPTWIKLGGMDLAWFKPARFN